MDRAVPQSADAEEQDQQRLIGDRLSAVWELSAAAYGIETERIGPIDKTITRVMRRKGDNDP